MADTVYSRTLRKAAALAGGNARLCRLLRVPSDALEKWLQGAESPPTAVFLQAVDLVVAEADTGVDRTPQPPSPLEAAPGGGFSARH